MIKKIDFTPIERDLKPIVEQSLCFIKPINGRMYRCFNIPDEDKSDELISVMNTICKSKKDGVYYFVIEDADDQNVFMDIFINMDLFPVVIDLNKTQENLN